MSQQCKKKKKGGKAAKLWRRQPAVCNLVSATAKKQHLIKEAVASFHLPRVKLNKTNPLHLSISLI